MTLKVGDTVRENAEYVRKNQYIGNRWNVDIVRLGRGRYKIYALDQISQIATVNYANQDIFADVAEPQRTKYWKDSERKVPLAQLESFPENPELEASYREVVKTIGPRIEECLRIARSAIDDAERFSEAYGIPFHGASGVAQSYTPSTLPDLDPSIIEEITGESIDPDGRKGWEQSAIC